MKCAIMGFKDECAEKCDLVKLYGQKGRKRILVNIFLMK